LPGQTLELISTVAMKKKFYNIVTSMVELRRGWFQNSKN